MPTYEYKCEACGHTFEKFHSITAKPIKKCPVCGKNKVKRLIGTGSGLIFKGSGFYITDYRSEGYKNSAKADTGSSASSETKPSGDSKPSTESKPAAESKPATSENKAKPAEKPAAKSDSPKPSKKKD